VRAASRRAIGLWAAAALAVVVLAAWRRGADNAFNDPDMLTGWLLLATVLGLALYGARRRLPMTPLGSASVWLALHVVAGTASLGAYAVHVGTLWPQGSADRALALLFLVTVLSGAAGHLLQLVVPARLTRAGEELIYERIPAEIARLRDAAESTITQSARQSGHDTLGTYYVQTLAWYFERPRFVLQHVLGTGAAQAWEAQKLRAVERLLAENERPHLDELARLCQRKRGADAQYALQALLRAWTFVHVPAASAFLVLAGWHMVIVIVYAA